MEFSLSILEKIVFMDSLLKVAILAPYPASAVLSPPAVKPKYWGVGHPAPWVKVLAEALARRGDVDLRVYVDSRAVRRRETAERAGVDYIFLNKWEPIRSDSYHFFLPGILRVRRELEKFKPDIVHGFGTESGCGFIAASMAYPSVVFIQGILEKIEPWRKGSPFTFFLRKQMEKRTLCRASAFVTETRFAESWVRGHNPKAIMRLIPHGMSIEFLNVVPEFREKRCLCVGAINGIKGTEMVIRAYAASEHSDTVLVLVGDGPERNRCRRLSAELGVSGNVVFMGRLDQNGNMLVLGSRMDTSPNVITEAHAAGLPVIGTRTGGIPEMIDDGRDGFVVPVDDTLAMADRMNQLNADLSLCRQMGLSGREKVTALNDPTSIAASHVEFYREVVKYFQNGSKAEPSTI